MTEYCTRYVITLSQTITENITGIGGFLKPYALYKSKIYLFTNTVIAQIGRVAEEIS